MKYYGFNACEALWKNRAVDIIRVYITEARMRDFGPLMKWCAQQKKAYHVSSSEELAKVAASVHHEGIVILAHAPKALSDEDLEQKLQGLIGPACLIYLDGVSNPHNIGSMIRVAAHFGVTLVLGRDGEMPRLSPSAARMAEGGLEHVTLIPLKKPEAALERLQAKGFKVVATSSHVPTSLYDNVLPERSVIVFGGETGGASGRMLKLADVVVKIPGTGAVESLNVAIACGLVLGEFWRGHKA